MVKKIIGFSARPNLKHPLFYYFYSLLRNIESIFINKYFNYNDSLMFIPLMFIGEFFAGLIVFLYQKKFVNKTLLEVENTDKYMNLELIKTEKSVKKIDTIKKMIFLLFCCAYFDFTQFLLSISNHKFINISGSIDLRFGGILLIIVSVLYYYGLKLPIMRHQVFCLIIIGIFSLIMIILEFIFQEINIFSSYSEFFVALLLSLIELFLNAMIGINEKYLYEFNNMNPFFALLFEGFFGFIFSFIYDIFNNPFEKINEFRKNRTSLEFIILIFCLILYAILSALKNLYRVNTTKIFTPMTSVAIQYILNPIFFIINFVIDSDFITKGEKNYAYFFINLIIGLIISFFGLAFNEFIILYFCGLDKDTHLQIVKRSAKDEKSIEFEAIINVDDNDDEN